MKKTILASIAAILLPTFAFAATGSITQSGTFSYTPTASADLIFNQFDASTIVGAKNVTLTSITFSLDITKSNGSIQVDNDSASIGSISLIQTVNLAITTRVYVPNWVTTLSATSTYTTAIGATTGDSTTVFNATNGADYVDSGLFLPVSSGTSETINGALASAGQTSYIGNGTYTVTANATQSTDTTGVSGVAVAYSPAAVSGTVRITYNYTYEAVPEPSTWAMIIGGTGLLVLGQRLRRRLS